jgi:hypothetical protein
MNAMLKPLDSRPVFARETCDQVYAEIVALIETHAAEVSHHLDIPVEMDEKRYRFAEKMNALRIYTVRVAGALVGYEVFQVGMSLHYNSSFQARMDTLFIHPDHRKGLTGYRFLKWAEQQLVDDGVEVAYRHYKFLEDGRLDLGPLLKRSGWSPIYLMWWKRLKAPRNGL